MKRKPFNLKKHISEKSYFALKCVFIVYDNSVALDLI